MIRDFLFQIFLCLGGSIIGIFVALLPKTGQKLSAGILALLLIMISLIWVGYELLERETSNDNPTAIVVPLNTATSISITPGNNTLPSPTPTVPLAPSISEPPPPIPVTSVMNDIPGTPLEIGREVTSVIDEKTKLRDVYAIQLEAGRRVIFRLSSERNLIIHLYNPDSISIEGRKTSQAFYRNTDNCVQDYIPAVSGVYYLSVKATNTGQIYKLAIESTGIIIPDNQGASDIPGTPLEIGREVTSVIDEKTKLRDVYAIQLEAGRRVFFRLSSEHNLIVHLFNPDSISIEGRKISQAFYRNTYDFVQDYIPAVSGVYYLSVKATNTGQIYTVSVTTE